MAGASLLLLGARALEAPAATYDEFLPLVAAERLRAGEVPYRDWLSLYPPLVTVLDAALFSVTGPSVLAARLAFAAIVAAGLVVATRIAARLCGDEGRATAIGLLGAAGVGLPPWGYPLVLGGVLVLASLLAALRARDEGASERWLVLAGALLGTAALARIEVAVAGSVAVLALALEGAGGRAWPRVARVVAAAAPLPLGCAGLLALAGAAPAAWDQLFGKVATVYPAARSLPWPSPFGAPGERWPPVFTVYAPVIVSALALLHAVGRARRARREGDAARAGQAFEAGVVAALGLLLLVSALVRPDRAHVRAASLASVAALGGLVGCVGGALRRPGTLGARVALGVALALLVPNAAREVRLAGLFAGKAVSERHDPAGSPVRRGLAGDGGVGDDRRRALELVATRPAGERIFVGLPRHDRIYQNDVAFYLDAGALPATRYHELHALVATTRECQEEIGRDLDRWRPTFVVLSDVPAPVEPNGSATVFPERFLDELIARDYAPVLEAGSYRVLRRRAGR